MRLAMLVRRCCGRRRRSCSLRESACSSSCRRPSIAGTGIALFDVWWLTALAERIPPDKLSRVTSYDWMVSLGLVPLGYLLAGPLAGAFGAVDVLLAGSALGLLVLAMGSLPRQTRMLERVRPEAGRAVRGRAASRRAARLIHRSAIRSPAQTLVIASTIASAGGRGVVHPPEDERGHSHAHQLGQRLELALRDRRLAERADHLDQDRARPGVDIDAGTAWISGPPPVSRNSILQA